MPKPTRTRHITMSRVNPEPRMPFFGDTTTPYASAALTGEFPASPTS